MGQWNVRYVTVCTMRKLICLALLTSVLAHVPAAQESAPAVFKSGVEQVAVTALVRDSRGKLVRDLKPC